MPFEMLREPHQKSRSRSGSYRGGTTPSAVCSNWKHPSVVGNAPFSATTVLKRDIERYQQYPNAVRDSRGRLRVGAAVGVKYFERIEALIKAEVDVLVVDTAHGHSQNVIDTVKHIKKNHKIDVIAGNVATAEATEELIKAGVNAV